MKESTTYLKWLAILCGVMAVFCIGIFIVGYKDLSIGRVMTVVALAVCSAAFGYLAWRRSH